MKENIILKTKVNWSIFNLFPIFTFFVLLFYLSLLLQVIFLLKILEIIIVLSTFIPITFFISFSVKIVKTWFKNYHDVIISDKGIKLNRKFLPWNKIKSISFNTNRFKGDLPFYMRKFSLPAFQELYILDKNGIEYSTNIDIDFSLKKNRNKNNLIKIRDVLLDLKKINLISDWAQKR